MLKRIFFSTLVLLGANTELIPFFQEEDAAKAIGNSNHFLSEGRFTGNGLLRDADQLLATTKNTLLKNAGYDLENMSRNQRLVTEKYWRKIHDYLEVAIFYHTKARRAKTQIDIKEINEDFIENQLKNFEKMQERYPNLSGSWLFFYTID